MMPSYVQFDSLSVCTVDCVLVTDDLRGPPLFLRSKKCGSATDLFSPAFRTLLHTVGDF